MDPQALYKQLEQVEKHNAETSAGIKEHLENPIVYIWMYIMRRCKTLHLFSNQTIFWLICTAIFFPNAEA